MSSELEVTGTDPQAMADLLAVLEQLETGIPLDAATARRIEARSELVTEGLRRKYGQLDIANELLRSVREEG